MYPTDARSTKKRICTVNDAATHHPYQTSCGRRIALVETEMCCCRWGGDVFGLIFIYVKLRPAIKRVTIYVINYLVCFKHLVSFNCYGKCLPLQRTMRFKGSSRKRYSTTSAQTSPTAVTGAFNVSVCDSGSAFALDESV